jgi:hypothetical protein
MGLHPRSHSTVEAAENAIVVDGKKSRSPPRRIGRLRGRSGAKIVIESTVTSPIAPAPRSTSKPARSA